MNPAVRKPSRILIPLVFAALLILAAAGRAASAFYTAASTDIAYPDWAESLAQYLAETLAALRVAVSIGAVAFARYAWGRSGAVTGGAILAAFLDYAARFVIDKTSGALGGYSLLAVLWLAGEFLYEILFLLLAALIVGAMWKKFRAAPSPRERKKFTPYRAASAAVLAYAVSRLLLEGVYLADFLLNNANVTSAEIASITGSFLKILVIYGAVSILAARGTVACLASLAARMKTAGRS